MTRLPREPLDADERALAAQLPRLHGRTEPEAALDARILAAAHAAVSSPARVAKRRRGWIVPLTAAASVSLAVGLAWQLQPPPARHVSPAHSPVATAGATAYEQDQAFVDAPVAAPAPPPPPAAVMAKPVPAPVMRQAAPAAEHARIAREAAPAAPAAESVAAAPIFVPPPPPEAVADAVPVASPPPLPPPAPPAPGQAAMARSSGALDTVTVGGTATREQAKRARQNEAEAAADAMTSAPFANAVDEEDVPPATMNAPAARDAWLRRIGELQQQGRIDDARASLAEFRRRYPDALLPQELRKLEP